jgi:hypothetical protein
MHGINLKPATAMPLAAASTISKPAMSTSPWREKLESVQQSDKLVKLLDSAGMITAEQRCDAGEIAASMDKSIDQVITTSFLSEKQGELWASALSYLERGIINEDLAVDALRLANARGMKFVDSLTYFGFGW